MKRWNGWGDTNVEATLPESAVAYLNDLVGEAEPLEDVPLADVVATVPESRLPEHPLLNRAPEVRVKYARGQSWPDWIAMRYGQMGVFPDGVAFPQTDMEVQMLLQLARDRDLKVIPYGGGTSVVGHVNPEPSPRPVLTISMERLNRLRRFDSNSHLATFDAGVSGPNLEAQLRAKGFTLGHFPQSFEYSTLGGWIVTRSSGQQSRGYGRIEDLFAGGKLYAPAGDLTLPPLPASSAGPDIRQLILGSEGRLGILTEATVRVSPLPEVERFHAMFFPSFEAGQAAVRQMMQAKIPLSMLRLSNAIETDTLLRMAGHERLIGTLETLLGFRGISEGKVMLLMGFTGQEALVNSARKEADRIAKANEGVYAGKQFGTQWQKGRFHSPYLRNTLWNMGYGVDTLETAVTWNKVDQTLAAMEESLRTALDEENEKLHVYTHLSHMYTSGCSIYTTYLFRLAHDPEEDLRRWYKMKTAASEAIVQHGGTISHQHGVGKDHKPYLPAEKGALGMRMMQSVIDELDPQGVMDNGNLV